MSGQHNSRVRGCEIWTWWTRQDTGGDMPRNNKDLILFLLSIIPFKCESTIEIERFYSMHLIPCISPLEAGADKFYFVWRASPRVGSCQVTRNSFHFPRWSWRVISQVSGNVITRGQAQQLQGRAISLFYCIVSVVPLLLKPGRVSETRPWEEAARSKYVILSQLFYARHFFIGLPPQTPRCRNNKILNPISIRNEHSDQYLEFLLKPPFEAPVTGCSVRRGRDVGCLLSNNLWMCCWLLVVHLTASVLLRAPPACLSIVTPRVASADRNCKCITWSVRSGGENIRSFFYQYISFLPLIFPVVGWFGWFDALKNFSEFHVVGWSDINI